ncbi:MAG: PhoP regulatory network YrbL family protein, partial [Helicobacteraceae bacterium]|nr:PhoP regulatory network YrbL family protein [Helicobacteraceae bacterium]
MIKTFRILGRRWRILEYVGEGKQRKCFVYPGDPGKVIKIPKPSGRQNTVEIDCYRFLEKRRVPLDHIARLYGEETVVDSDGKAYRGFVFERALND